MEIDGHLITNGYPESIARHEVTSFRWIVGGGGGVFAEFPLSYQMLVEKVEEEEKKQNEEQRV